MKKMNDTTASCVNSTAAIAEGLLSYYTSEIFDTRKIPMIQNRETKSKEAVTTSELVVSPNPVSSELSIKLPNHFDCNNTTVQCFNLQGKLMKTSALNCDNCRINVSDLTSGFYLLILNDHLHTEKAKFVKIN
jgi:hypothetical protein